MPMVNLLLSMNRVKLDLFVVNFEFLTLKACRVFFTNAFESEKRYSSVNIRVRKDILCV